MIKRKSMIYKNMFKIYFLKMIFSYFIYFLIDILKNNYKNMDNDYKNYF